MMPWLWRALRKMRTWDDDKVAEGIEEVVAVGLPAVPELIQLIELGGHADEEKHPNFRAVQGAIQALQRIGDPHAVNAIIDALNDRDSRVHEAAEEALQTFDTTEAREALEKIKQQQRRVIDEDICFVRAYRLFEGQWIAEAMDIANGFDRAYHYEKWNAWLLPDSSLPVTCEQASSRKKRNPDYMGEPGEIDPETSSKSRWEQAWEQWAAYTFTQEVLHLSRLQIDPLPPKEMLPFFIATVPNRVPCAYRVTVRMNFRTWDEYPDVKKLQSTLFRNKPVSSEDSTAQLLRQAAPRHSPGPGQDFCVHVQTGEREVTGVLRLQDRVGEEANDSGQTFQAELHLSDLVPDVVSGIQVMRRMSWWEFRTPKSIEIVVATVLSASRLS